MNPEELSRRLLDFAVRIGRVADALPRTSLGRHIAGQLVRCGTSPAPNYEEGCAAVEERVGQLGLERRPTARLSWRQQTGAKRPAVDAQLEPLVKRPFGIVLTRSLPVHSLSGETGQPIETSAARARVRSHAQCWLFRRPSGVQRSSVKSSPPHEISLKRRSMDSSNDKDSSENSEPKFCVAPR